jgi:hypothetical protein
MKAEVNPLPGPGGNILPVCHQTFQGFYSNVELVPCQGHYDRIMSQFNLDENPNVTHVRLYEQAVEAGAVP